MSTYDETIGANIAALRTAAGLTQTDVARSLTENGMGEGGVTTRAVDLNVTLIKWSIISDQVQSFLEDQSRSLITGSAS